MKPPKTQWTLQKPTFLPFQIWQKSCSSVFTAGFELFEDERNLFCTSSRKTFSHFCTLQANWPPVKSAPACRSLFEDWRQLLQPGDGHVQVHPSQTEREGEYLQSIVFPGSSTIKWISGFCSSPHPTTQSGWKKIFKASTMTCTCLQT